MSKAKACRIASTNVSAPSKASASLRRVSSTPARVPSTPLRRVASTPVSVPSSSLRKKSILKNSTVCSSSVESDNTPASSPDFQERRVRRVSQVRFSDDLNSDIFDKYSGSNTEASGNKRTVSSSVFREIPLSKLHNATSRDKWSDSDSLNEDDDSDADSDDSMTSANLPSLHISATMSPEAQYAILKAYEDQLYQKINKVFPNVALELKRNRTPDNRQTVESELLEFGRDSSSLSDEHSRSSSPNAHKVANRLQRAMDILDSVRDSCDENVRPASSFKRTVAKNPVRSFEKWCHSLRDTLDELGLNCNTKH